MPQNHQMISLDVVGNSIVKDTPDATVSALRESLDKADIAIISGGVSVGDFDFVTDAIEKVGVKIHFSRVAVKPGKPMTFASSREKAIFGLPENPVAVYLIFHLFVLRSARFITGQNVS